MKDYTRILKANEALVVEIQDRLMKMEGTKLFDKSVNIPMERYSGSGQEFAEALNSIGFKAFNGYTLNVKLA